MTTQIKIGKALCRWLRKKVPGGNIQYCVRRHYRQRIWDRVYAVKVATIIFYLASTIMVLGFGTSYKKTKGYFIFGEPYRLDVLCAGETGFCVLKMGENKNSVNFNTVVIGKNTRE